ncbi:MAG: MFS transporter [Burkholderiaceae bacterium]|jgi:MFS family permease|nr:MFS transporter [Burkholderiaceae bacterium]
MKRDTTSQPATIAAAWIVILVGVSAAMHIAKLPPALPVLQRELGIGLVQAGFLLSRVQLATTSLGLVAGLTVEGIGLKRSMMAGLALLFAAGLAGGWARDVGVLLALRALEGLGFLLATVPAPSLVRRCVPPSHAVRMLGFWGAFMPFGTALALLCGPAVMAGVGWPGWWWLVALLSGVMALAVYWRVPADPPALAHAARAEGWGARLTSTLGAGGPWLAGLTFGFYSMQWIAVIGFLPTLYAQSGWSGALVAVLTALVAAANIIGNVIVGPLLGRGASPRALLWSGFAAMALGAFVAFGPLTRDLALLRYLGALLFSAVGGLIPGSLFALTPRLAPSERTVATTVGWIMQCSAAGQVGGPPLVAWVAKRAGGDWQWTWAVTGAACLCGAALAWLMGRRLKTLERERASC